MSQNSNYRVNGLAIIQSGSTDLKEVLGLSPGESFDARYIKAQYPDTATTNAQLVISDSDFSGGNTQPGRQRESLVLSPGETFVVENGYYSTFERDVTCQASGSLDANVSLTIGGVVITG